MAVSFVNDNVTVEIEQPDFSNPQYITIVDAGIAAGFPSPAADYLGVGIDLNKELVHNPSATFYGRVKGDSMQGAGIFDGDIIVIDKSLTPQNGDVAVCFLNGEFTLKTISIEDNVLYLMPANDKYQPIKVNPENDFVVWGVVTYVISAVSRKK